MVIIIRRPILITIDVLYYRPDFVDLLQNFIWQTDDFPPDYPRAQKFLFYWKDNINAIIHSVSIVHSNGSLRPVDLERLFDRNNSRLQ